MMTIHRLMTASFFCATLISSLTPVFALDVAQVPTSKRTKPGLYLDAKEAYEIKQQQGDKLLFVDIRTRGEIIYTGVATSVDAYVPIYEHPPNAAWDEKAGRFQLELNKDFENEIMRRANAKGLSKNDPVVLICRSGDRSGRAATQLSEAGFAQVYTVVDGFEGDVAKEGQNAGKRVVNGWKNAGLPWSYRLEKEKFTLPEPR
jgi:rhodanese-related sulfurtransferase